MRKAGTRMNPPKALTFIQSVPWQACRPGLDRIWELMRRLGNPQESLKYIHITGTNGKGSTAAMLAAMLQAAGYRTGLFTSPHLQFYNERIQVNGRLISDEAMDALADEIRPAADAMTDAPSEFERLAAMAFLYFRQEQCDFVVLEVGLGGELDCTNVIPPPEAAVITAIGLEHTEYLGHTLSAIAATKAGIIKPGADVILWGQSPEVEAVVRDRCRRLGCPLTVSDPRQLRRISGDLTGQVLQYRARKTLSLGLLGTYQLSNAAVALDTADALIRRGWAIPESALRSGLAHAVWPGRFEVLCRRPLVLVDGAHNPNGAQELSRCLETYLPGKKITFVMGVMADKDSGQMLSQMAPLARRFITVAPESGRSLSAGDLAAKVRLLDLPVQEAPSVESGISLALRLCGPEDAVCIFGSLYQVGPSRAFFGK